MDLWGQVLHQFLRPDPAGSDWYGGSAVEGSCFIVYGKKENCGRHRLKLYPDKYAEMFPLAVEELIGSIRSEHL